MTTTHLRSDTSEWLKFFESAGIPPKIALQYSMLFGDHRIQRSQLIDLNKNLLKEIGVTAVGDVLAIVKHARMITAEEAEQLTYEKIRQSSKKPSISSEAKISTTHLESISAKKQKLAPDHDVVYIKKFPSGTTERSKLLLQKAAETKKSSNSSQSVFDRLGSSPSRLTSEELLRKNVKFAIGTKEFLASPEVSSTTVDEFSTLESDRIQQKSKSSALGRLGGTKTRTIGAESGSPISFQSTTALSKKMTQSPLTGTITVTGGKRTFLTAVRSGSARSGVLGTSVSTATAFKRTISSGAAGESDVKSRLGPKPLDQKTAKSSASIEKCDVFSRLGKRKSF